MFLVFTRFVLSAVPAVFFVRRPNVAFKYLLAYSLFTGVGQYSLLYGALKLGMPAGLSSIVMQVQAFATMGFAAMLIGEQVRPAQGVGVLIACVGLALIALNFRQGNGDGVGLLPLVMVLGAAMSWGLGNVVTRMASMAAPKGEKMDMVSFTLWSSLLPPIPMLALSLLIEGPAQIAFALTHVTWTTVGAALYTAYLSTVFGFVAWNKLIAKRGAGPVAPFSLLVPFFGLLSTALALASSWLTDLLTILSTDLIMDLS
ncbi:MAG: EamA family transporter, partial [Sphingomonadales bacterium]|nr:EamA family transporter [Sphingomonadales bacterium]